MLQANAVAPGRMVKQFFGRWKLDPNYRIGINARQEAGIGWSPAIRAPAQTAHVQSGASGPEEATGSVTRIPAFEP